VISDNGVLFEGLMRLCPFSTVLVLTILVRLFGGSIFETQHQVDLLNCFQMQDVVSLLVVYEI